MRWMIACIVACFLAASLPPDAVAGYCNACHLPAKGQVHAALVCTDCHLAGGHSSSDPASRESGAAGCVACHRGYERIFAGAMGSRAGERAFADRTYHRHDPGFFPANCGGCHLAGCGSCHGSGHRITRPGSDRCLACHKGYFTGWDYLGRAPREENNRYQRGGMAAGERFLAMLPDVHFRAGIPCSGCHTMKSLLAGSGGRTCRECHTPDRRVLEHRIGGHLERLECTACHAAWSPQEYGTFSLRFADPAVKEEFDLRPGASPAYLKSSYLKRQDLPPLGLNNRGLVSPIRPQFIVFYTDIDAARGGSRENLLLAAEWRAFTPHTVQRGTTACGGCHDNPRRFLLEPAGEEIYLLRRDGLPLDSFWQRQGQRVTNGSFLPEERYRRMATGSRDYQRGEVEKWRAFINRVEPSSAE